MYMRLVFLIETYVEGLEKRERKQSQPLRWIWTPQMRANAKKAFSALASTNSGDCGVGTPTRVHRPQQRVLWKAPVARRWGTQEKRLPLQLALPPRPLAHVVSLFSRVLGSSPLPPQIPPIVGSVGSRAHFEGFFAGSAGFGEVGWEALVGGGGRGRAGRCILPPRSAWAEGGEIWSAENMGFLPAKLLPSCESMCVCCPALRPSSRRPVKRYKKLLAEIFPKTPVSTARLSFLCSLSSARV
jgi:hypothetical protein